MKTEYEKELETRLKDTEEKKAQLVDQLLNVADTLFELMDELNGEAKKTAASSASDIHALLKNQSAT